MTEGFAHILPIFLIASLGAALKRKFLTSEEFWKGLEKLSFFVFTPCIMFNNTANNDLSVAPIFKIILCLILSCCILGIGLVYFNNKTRGDPLKFTSVFQGSFRFNSLIFLALAKAIYGIEGLEVAAIIAVYMIIFINFSIILIYNLYIKQYDSEGIYNNIIVISKNIFFTPVILSSISGLLFNFLEKNFNFANQMNVSFQKNFLWI